MAKMKPQANSSSKSETKADGVAPYFRGIFEANQKLLKSRSNKEVLAQWLTDHPGHSEIPKNVKTGLANLKSVMRKALRKKRGRVAAAGAVGGKPVTKTKYAAMQILSTNPADTSLEHLELLIDECLTVAKTLDRIGLGKVIMLLRNARNGVVWKLGGGDE
jgi:hypothetical protein